MGDGEPGASRARASSTGAPTQRGPPTRKWGAVTACRRCPMRQVSRHNGTRRAHRCRSRDRFFGSVKEADLDALTRPWCSRFSSAYRTSRAVASVPQLDGLVTLTGSAAVITAPCCLPPTLYHMRSTQSPAPLNAPNGRPGWPTSLLG